MKPILYYAALENGFTASTCFTSEETTFTFSNNSSYSPKNAGEVYISESGHLEFSFSASAGAALQKAFHAVPGEAFGFMAGSPAAIGLVMADTAMKASAVSITCYMTPSIGTSHSNEVILGISGDASAVKAAVLEARQIGLELLIGMGSYPEIPGTPYL